MKQIGNYRVGLLCKMAENMAVPHDPFTLNACFVICCLNVTKIYMKSIYEKIIVYVCPFLFLFEIGLMAYVLRYTGIHGQLNLSLRWIALKIVLSL